MAAEMLASDFPVVFLGAGNVSLDGVILAIDQELTGWSCSSEKIMGQSRDFGRDFGLFVE